MSTSTLKDYEGNQFAVDQLVSLANQVAQKFDYNTSTGGVFKTEKESIGFDYPELQRAFGENAKINVFNQVALDIARTLLSKGITDLSLLEGAKGVIPKNTRGGINYLIPDRPGLEKLPLDAQGNRVLAGLQQDGVRLGETATGDGKTVYYLDLSSGTPSIKTKAIETSDKGTALFVVSMALMAVPGAGTAIGSALGATGTTATALGNAVINTATQVAAGVPIDKAIVNSAASYGVSQFVPNLTNNPYVDNAIRSVAIAKLTGGDEQMALANSLIATGATDLLGTASITGDKTIDSGLVSGLTSSLQAKVTGGDAGASFVQGFTRGASTKISQDEARAQRAASGAGFVGEAPFELGGVTLDTTTGGQQTTVSGGGVIAGPGITTLGDLIVRLDNGETIDLGQTPLPTGEVGALRISMSRTSGQGEVNPLAVAQQTAKQRTVSPQQASDEMLTPIAQYFQIPNGSTFVRDLRNGQITEVVGEGSATKIGGGALNLDFTTVGRVEGVPSNAQYAGVLYTTDLDAATDPYANFNNIDVSTLSLTRGFDPNVGMPANLERVVNSDGSVVQIDKRFGDRSYFSPDGTLFDSYKTTYSKINDVANTLASIATSAPGEWSESVANGLKVLGIPSDKLAAAADKLNQYGTNIAPAQVNALQAQWVRDVQDAVARNNYGREANDGVNLLRDIYNITLDNPIGGFTLVGKEIFQEAPEAAIGGVAGFAGKVAGTIGVFVSQVLESAGGTYKESIQRIEDEIQRGFRAPMSRQEIEAEARTNATKGGGITALLTALTPGGRTVTGAVRNEMATEGLETYLTARATGQSHEAAMQDSVVAGTIAGKVVGSMYAGDLASQKVSNLTGTQPTTDVGATQQITINGAKIGRIAGLDDTGELVFVVTDDGNQLTIPSVNVLNNDTSREGQLVLLNNENQIVANADTRSQLPAISPQGIAVIPTGGLPLSTKVETPIVSGGGEVTVGGGQIVPAGETPTVTDTKAVMPDTAAVIPTEPETPAETPSTTPTIKISEGVRREPTTYTGDLQGQRGTGAARLDEFQRTFQGTLYPTVEARNAAMQAYYASLGIRTEPETTAPTDTFTVSKPVVRDDANLADVISRLGSLGFTPTNEVVSQLMAGNPTKAEVNQRIDAQTYNNRFYATAQEAANAKLKDDLIRVGNDLISQGKSFEEVTSFLNGQLGALGLASGITMKNGRPEVMLVATQQVQRSTAPVTSVQTDPAFAEAKARIEDAKARAAANTARAEEQARTFNGTVYPTVEARNQAAADFAASAGITTTEKVASDVTENPPGVANLASVVNFLGLMGITPTQSMMDALMAGNPTNAEILTRIRSNPEILAAVAARGQTQDTGTKVGPGGQVVTGGDVKAGGGEIVQEQKPAEIDVANQPASQQDVVALLGRMGLPTSAAFVAELTKNNATNAQVLQRLQADPAVQALIRQQRFGQTDTAIVVAVNPTNNTALVIDTKGNTKTIEAVDTKTGQTLVEDQVITVPVVTETAQTFTFDPAESLIKTRFEQNGKVATQQDIASLKAAAQQAGIDFTSDNFGTTPAYQRWATLVNDTARGVKPYVAPTVTPEVKVDAGTKVTPSVTESIDLTFDPGRVNIDTPEDTVQAQDTFSFVDTTPVIDTTPTFDTVVDTLPQDTVPTYGEDEDIIRFLGLDQQPTPTEPEAPPAEDTIGGGTGTTNIIPEERLAVAPKAVYTPKPGTRVVDTGTSTGILPTRVQLSEGMGDDVEGTGEEEQQPVWNVRSLKLRRALGI